MKSGRHFHITGIVQGVGFRPFVYHLAAEKNLKGEVFNSSDGVIINVFGEKETLEHLEKALWNESPPLSQIFQITSTEIPWETRTSFVILNSRENPDVFMPVSPDIAICENCKREILDPKDRRFHYPFTNCTNCGPRFSIIEKLPYDRPYTSMKCFPLCKKCQIEYEDPTDRRFHAQPVACEKCGPTLSIYGTSIHGYEALIYAVRQLKDGKIVAIKGIGGFHLACDALNLDALLRLREKKQRSDKAFALMARDITTIEKYCAVSQKENEILSSPAAPILLLKKKSQGRQLQENIAPGQQRLGFMLPYTPLHILLFDALAPNVDVLVMTSANINEEPIVYRDDDIPRLQPLADFILTHDRPIVTRIDDSVVSIDNFSTSGKEVLRMVRRARGYAPQPIQLSHPYSQILACGGEMKNTFCLTRENYAFVSHHIGDLENYETQEAFAQTVDHYQKLFRIHPKTLVCDLHPLYFTTSYAEKRAAQDNIPIIKVQHHYAHIASVLAENKRFTTKPVIGLAFDGTGYGTDGTIWGGECLICNSEGFSRLFHLVPFPIPGGDVSIHKPSRLALALLFANGFSWTKSNAAMSALSEKEKHLLLMQLTSHLNCVNTSSIGRLFDAIASLAGVRQSITYEGQAAIELENVACPDYTESYPIEISRELILIKPLLSELLFDLDSNTPVAIISAKFHNAMISMCLEVCDKIKEEYGIHDVALSGGVWQNQILLKGAAIGLQERGFNLYLPHDLPFNDGCISFGQAAVADAQLKKEA